MLENQDELKWNPCERNQRYNRLQNLLELWIKGQAASAKTKRESHHEVQQAPNRRLFARWYGNNRQHFCIVLNQVSGPPFTHFQKICRLVSWKFLYRRAWGLFSDTLPSRNEVVDFLPNTHRWGGFQASLDQGTRTQHFKLGTAEKAIFKINSRLF